ncbi:unnamed protein product [Fraxinus pennsylvanica]|uniref:Mediator of RNA polymerase II transcription subunit 10 n=1 Tax=Fraxinus pennsylvanica TaxID=56036 RepID=A0AAD1Z881_9LAMI|nr:unnamed protein product [Fraxinus pennsylvanica]
MTKLAEICNIQVPMEVINLIDDGKNPDEFGRVEYLYCQKPDCLRQNKKFKSWRSNLIQELEQEFPVAAFVAERKQFAQAESTLPNGEAEVNKLRCEKHGIEESI